MLGRTATEKANLKHVLDPVDSRGFGGFPNQVLQDGQILRQERLGEIREIQVHVHLAHLLGDLAQKLLEVDSRSGEIASDLAEGLLQAVVETRPEKIKELVVGADLIATLDHRRAQRVLEDVALLQRQFIQRLEGVDGLRDRDTNAALAQQVRELD